MQAAFGAAGLARLKRFIPRSVMIGFVNTLGILIFFAQVPHLLDTTLVVYPLFAPVVAIVLLLPKLTTAVPAALVTIVMVTEIVMMGQLKALGVANILAGFYAGIVGFAMIGQTIVNVKIGGRPHVFRRWSPPLSGSRSSPALAILWPRSR